MVFPAAADFGDCFYLKLGDASLPEEQPDELTEDQLKALHHVLMEVGLCQSSFGPEVLMDGTQMHVEEGNMTCRGCGHVYPISNGIPNMVSSELVRTFVRSLLRSLQPKLLAEHEIGR